MFCMSLTLSRYWSDISITGIRANYSRYQCRLIPTIVITNTDISLRGLVGLVDLLWDSLDGESKVALFSLPLQHNK